MIDKETLLTVKLTASQWDQVLGIMSEAPLAHRIVDPVMRAIYEQCRAHDQSPPEAAPERLALRAVEGDN